MSAVRNFCLGRGAVPAAAWTSIYTAPVDSSVILKNLAFINRNSTSQNVTLALLSRDASQRIPILTQLATAGVGYVLTTWAVLNHGDAVQIWADAANVSYWVSGAVLPMASGQVSPAAVVAAEAGEIDTPPVAVVYLPEGQTFRVGL